MKRVGNISFLLVVITLWLLPKSLWCVTTDSVLVEPARRAPVQMDFLSGYYQQDGNHSAVTGGEGTESLKDFASVIKIHIPLKNSRSLDLDTRMNYFSSASSDNIDPKANTGASRNDFKINIQARVNRDLKKSPHRLYYELGASHEAHFASVNLGLGMNGKMVNGQSEWHFTTGYILDIWGPHYELSKLYPSDYYGSEDLTSNKRHTLNLDLGFQQIVNPSLKIGFSVGVIQQFGLLSTPYHRIYFDDTQRIDIERLPGYRFRLPASARLNWYATDWLILRTYYRFYWDNFEMKSHTTSIELPIKPLSQLSVYPFYRYHHQQGHEYFAGKGIHMSSEEFYTSDYDQSDLHSHYIGGGFRWTPFFLKRKKSDRRIEFEAVEARGAYYVRNDGFHSWIISGGLSWAILRKGERSSTPYFQ